MNKAKRSAEEMYTRGKREYSMYTQIIQYIYTRKEYNIQIYKCTDRDERAQTDGSYPGVGFENESILFASEDWTSSFNYQPMIILPYKEDVQLDFRVSEVSFGC